MPEETVRRFRFVPPGLSGGSAYRTFRQPRPTAAVEDRVPPSHPVEGRELRIVAAIPAGEPALRVKSKGLEVAWQPGRASVTAPADQAEHLVAALVEFTHYEGELRRLEAALAEGLPEAERDIDFAFRIRPGDVPQRDRVTERVKGYARLRLEFAQLDFFLHTPCGELHPTSRRWLKALLRKADVAARAEAFSHQLEAREELYDGAADRFADHDGWAVGHRLEVIIVALLLIEIVFMAAEFTVHMIDR